MFAVAPSLSSSLLNPINPSLQRLCPARNPKTFHGSASSNEFARTQMLGYKESSPRRIGVVGPHWLRTRSTSRRIQYRFLRWAQRSRQSHRWFYLGCCYLWEEGIDSEKSVQRPPFRKTWSDSKDERRQWQSSPEAYSSNLCENQ